MILVKYYDITENDLKSKSYEQDALYYCSDTRNIYFDSPTKQKRIRMSSDTIILSKESDRTGIIAPIPDKLYVVLETGSMFMYSAGQWIKLSSSQFEISNVIVKGGTLTISDSRIKAASTGEFIPDLSVADIVTSSKVTCSNGSLTITVSPSTYNIMGRVLIS